MTPVSLTSLKAHARAIRDGAIRDGVIRDDAGGTADAADFISFGAATEYLRAVVGNEWANQMVFSQHPTVSRINRQGRTFMRAEADDDEQYRNLERTRRIAELLFNLQGVEGVGGRVHDLRAGKLEEARGILSVC